MFPFKYSRTSQPQGAVGIDWSNPITRGLQVCVDSAGNSYGRKAIRNLVFASGYSKRVANSGVAIDASAASPGFTFDLPVGFTNLPELTLVTVGHVFARLSPTSPQLSNHGGYGGGGTGIYASPYTAGAEVYASTYYYPDFNGDVVASSTTAIPVSGKCVLATTFRKSDFFKLYSGGLLLTSVATAAFSANLSYYDTSWSVNTLTQGVNVQLTLMFDRTLSDAEIKSLSDNPWQIFQPLGRDLGFSPSVAGIAFDAAGNSGDVAAASSYGGSASWLGSNRMLSVDVSMLGPGVTVTAMTYGGAACTFIGSKSTVTSLGGVECWRICSSDSGAPAAGSNTLSVTLSGTIEFSVEWASYTGVHQTSPTEGFNSAQATNAGSATDASVSITSVADNCFIHAAVVANDTAITAGNTSRNNISGTLGSGANEDNGAAKTPAGAVTMSYSGMGITTTWAIAGYAIRPVAASGATTHATSGALATIGATVAGAAARFRAFATSGVLATLGATITGTAARFRAMSTTGALATSGATVSGSAARFRAFGTSGALAPTGAVITGISLRYRVMDASGALVTAGAAITGDAAHTRVHAASGTLATAGANIAGSALRLTPGGGVYPDPADVRAGVIYGPTGVEFTGTMSILLDLNTGRLVKIIGQKVALLL